jgi:hypothetical protein
VEGIDLVICTFGPGADSGASERALAQASKSVGVKLFVTSAWGTYYQDPKTEPLHPMIAEKIGFQDELKEVSCAERLILLCSES